MDNKRDPSAGRNNSDQPAGQIRFDDRGNAVWESGRGRRLENHTLALLEDQPERDGHRTNYSGRHVGYNPYDSGVLSKGSQRHKKDLRALSEWIERQRRRDR